METIKKRLEYLSHYYGLSMRKFEEKCGLNRGNLSNMKDGSAIGSDKLTLIFDNIPGVNPEWLLTGKGEMMRTDETSTSDDSQKQKGNLIPFYEDAVTIGGVNSITASMDGVMPSSEFIDAGDWFIGATAAIRHYGDSMQEYPSGCIIVLKEVHDKQQVVWGRNYCVETIEFRITKKLQRGTDEYHYTAYSTNESTYADGHLIHEPISIKVDDIRRLFLVMGCVIKEQSSGPIYIQN